MKRLIFNIGNFFRMIKSYFMTKKVETKMKKSFRFLGSASKRKGQKLYAFDKENDVVYPVKIYNGTRALLDKDHSVLWAINLRNAIRKFKKGNVKIDHKAIL